MTFYNQNAMYFNPAVSDNLLFDNNVTKGTTATEKFQANPQQISIVNSANNIANGREPIVISEGILKFKGPARVAPKILRPLGGDRAIIEYEFKTVGWVNPNELIAQFTTIIEGKGASLLSVSNGQDTFRASKQIQAPFCFLNPIEELDGWIGTRKDDTFLDKNLKSDILALKSIMCLRPRTKEEHLLVCSAGLPCSKSSIIADFEDEDIARAYDNRFQDLIGNVRSNVNGGNPSTYQAEYPYMVFLKDLYPFLDTDKWLPPNTMLNFKFKFNNRPNANQFRSKTEGSNRLNCVRSIPPLQTIDGSFTKGGFDQIITGDATKNMIIYNYYQLIDDTITLPPTILDVWGYKKHEFRPLGTEASGYKYNFSIPNVIQPTSVIFYLSSDVDCSISPIWFGSGSGQSNYLGKVTDSLGYLAGMNINSFEISLGAEQFVMADNLNTNNLTTYVGQGIGWCNNQPLYCVLLNRLRDKQMAIDEYVPSTIKFNQLDNIIPIEFNLQPQDVNNLYERPLPFGSSQMNISFSVKGTYFYWPRDGTSVEISDKLPPNTIINFLFKYPYQIIESDEGVFSYVAPPYRAEQVAGSNQTEQLIDVATN